jgi:hypothetical protein
MIKEKKVTILIATQNKVDFDTHLNTFYKPIFVGADLVLDTEIGYTKDNEGDNISKKNKSFCELTALYWAWKNLNSDYVGLCHYRRYFLFDYKSIFKFDRIPILKCDNIFLNNLNTSESYLQNLIDTYGIITTNPRITVGSIEKSYENDNANFVKDFLIMKDIIIEKYPTYKDNMNKHFNQNKLRHYNMFIMSKLDYDKYCNWLFDILFECEKRIDISEYNVIQKRVFGFLAERLLSLYIFHNFENKYEVPVGYLNPSHRLFKIYKGNNYKLNEILFSILNIFNKLIYKR